MRIILSGLTAAGKTTHGELLANAYGLRFVRMVDVMGKVLADRHPSSVLNGGITDVWTKSRDHLREQDSETDRQADRLMVAEVEKASGVFDAWALPWLYSGSDAIRVWISSDAASRGRKHTVSALMRGVTPPPDPVAVNAEKDEWTKRWFTELYGFKLEPSSAVFDVVADNSHLIPEATIAAAEVGIATFQPTLTKAIERVRYHRS
jgi:cytidylate kinase